MASTNTHMAIDTLPAKRARSPSVTPLDDTCAICLETMGAGDATFHGSCGHNFHVQCIEADVVTHRSARCPCCRAQWANAPGLVALRRPVTAPPPPFERQPQPLRNTNQLLDVAPPTPPVQTSGLQLGSLAEGWCSLKCITDFTTLPPGVATEVTALLKTSFANDDDSTPFRVPADFVILADCSGSMSGDKVEALRDTLLKVRVPAPPPASRTPALTASRAPCR